MNRLNAHSTQRLTMLSVSSLGRKECSVPINFVYLFTVISPIELWLQFSRRLLTVCYDF